MSVAPTSQLGECFKSLATEAKELYLGKAAVEVRITPHSLEFLRDFVSQNKPLVIRGGCKHWPAIKKWTHSYLREKIGSNEVTAAVTPNGYADAVYDGKFTLPEERKIRMSEFLDILELHKHNLDEQRNGYKTKTTDGVDSEENSIFYLQKQNSSLMTEFPDILDDVQESFSWANEAFGCKPDAVNFWMGEERAITSLHKDNYENIYCVVKGEKTFILLPPTDQPFIPYELYPVAQFASNGEGAFRLIDLNEQVRWTSVDPTQPDIAMKLNPMRVTLYSGDVLYLPSLWFHHVTQSHGCIAVNYWYDMAYDIKYNYFKFVESLLVSCSGHFKQDK